MAEKYRLCLLIDDDSISNVLAENALIKNEVCSNIQKYLSVEEALVFLNSQINNQIFPDLILLDLDFPSDKNGWYFLEIFQQNYKSEFNKTKLFILTSTISKKDIDKVMSYPFIAGFISKPLMKDKVKILL
jgi:CheY-like chemotaxis protein